MAGLLKKGIEFFTRQQPAFRVNMVKNLVQNFSLSLTQQYNSIYVTALGANAQELGYVAGIGGIAFALVTLPVGLLAIRYGIRKILLVALFLLAVGYGVFASAPNWQSTALAFVLTTVAIEMTMTVCPMICGASLNSSERSMGMQFCDTVSAFPRLAGPIVAAILIPVFGGLVAEGIRPLYWISTGGILVALFIVWLKFKNPPQASGSRMSFREGIQRVFTEGVHIKRWSLYMGLGMLPVYMSLYIPLYVKMFRSATPLTLGLMDVGYWLVIVALALPVGFSADRYGRRRLIILLAPLYSLGLLVLIYLPGDLALPIAGMLTGFLMLTNVTGGSIAAELVPREILGSFYGLMGLVRGVVGLASPILGGYIWNTFGPVYVLYFLAVVQILKLGVLATMPEKTQYSI
jgi:MFS family permease